jgi:hypothetical protein
LAATADSLYVVNDGGDQVRVFVLDRSCQVRQVVRAAINPFDVEDLARTADGTLWLADTGDNDGIRPTVAMELVTGSGQARLFRFRYPDGPHDAEALLVDANGRPFVVTKNPLGTSGVYTPAQTPSPNRVTPLRKVTTLRFSLTGTAGGPVGVVSQLLVTGGAVAPDGRRLVLRTYTDAYLWDSPDGDIAGALRSGKPYRVPLPASRQGEAVAFSADGGSLLVTTEGLPAPVHMVPLPARPVTSASTASPTTGTRTGAAAPSQTDSGDRPMTVRRTVTAGIAAALVATAVVWAAGRIRRRWRDC